MTVHHILKLDNEGHIFFYSKYDSQKELLIEKKYDFPLVLGDIWSEFVIVYDESFLKIFKESVEILYFESSKPLIFYWFSVSTDRNWLTWSANCEEFNLTSITVDGEWSEWSSWECSATCGGGIGVRVHPLKCANLKYTIFRIENFHFQVRKRVCNIPQMNLFGKPCPGSSTDKGYCNSFDCYDVPTLLLNFVQDQLKLYHYSIEAHVHDNVSMKLPFALSDFLSKQSFPYSLMWMFNGVYLERSNLSELLVENVCLQDTGVYTCFIQSNINKYPIMVYSLAVKNNLYDFVVDFNTRFSMKCFGIYLGLIYSDLSQKWYLNERIYEKSDVVYGDKTIFPMNETHIGKWKCTIEKRSTNFSWTAGIYNINVKEAENPLFIFSYVFTDKYPTGIFNIASSYSYIILSIFYILILLVILISLYFLKKKYLHVNFV